MTKLLILSVCFLASASGAFAQVYQTKTYVVTATNGVVVTNYVTILNGNAARVSAFHPRGIGPGGSDYPGTQMMLRKGDRAWPVFKGDVIQGPATIELWAVPSSVPGADYPALLTLERWAVPRVPVPVVR